MPEPQVVTTTVTVTGLVPGEPPTVAWCKRLRGLGGREKVHTQWVKVPDPALFQRLQRDVRVGDEIVATVITDWHESGYTTYLADFSTAVGDEAAAEPLLPRRWTPRGADTR